MPFPCKPTMYQGRQIVHVSHAGLQGAELLASLKECSKYLLAQHQPVLLLVDFTDILVTNEIMAYMKSPEAMEAGKKAAKTAVIGMVGIKQIFLNTYNSFAGIKAKAFTAEEEAKKYLIA